MPSEKNPRSAQQLDRDLHEAVTAVVRRSHIERMKRVLATARTHAERAPPERPDDHARRVELIEAELHALGES